MNYPSCIKMPISKADVSSSDNEIIPQVENGFNFHNELLLVANEVFGHGKWSHAVTSQTVDFVEYVMGKYHIGCAAFVRVQLPDGTFHEEMGYSNAESVVKGSAVYSARASSITNALRKALLCFGGVIQEKIDAIPCGNAKRKLQKLETEEYQRENNNKKEICKLPRSNSSSRRPKSPNVETDSNKTTNCEVPVKKETAEPVIASNITIPQITKPLVMKISENTSVTRPMTEEELRMERKRKQKEKQEEYRRQMLKEAELKHSEKLNSKF